MTAAGETPTAAAPPAAPELAAGELLALAAELVDIPSVTGDEAVLASRIEDELRRVPWLGVERVGDSIVARTQLGRSVRVVLAGHTDTVPGPPGARLEGELLYGTGSADMKGALAVFLELARHLDAPTVDVTYVFYAREEGSFAGNELGVLLGERPDLLAGDLVVLGEPTGGWIEAGCQGSLRVEVTLAGRRAHTARPWMGENAVHRLGALLERVAAWAERRPVIDGCEYREALQAVSVSGGIASNVVPDRATVTLNHRVAPDRTLDEAFERLRAYLEPVLAEGDELVVTDRSDPAPPGLDHPLVGSFIARNRLEVRAKLGWTDVARFAGLGVPAVNFGPGDPELAHTEGEHVDRASLERAHAALLELLTHPA
ncbi:MAG TPA: succinyl-diaminopimelate desuccinylase [Acidimicrobiales bacterium]